MPRRQVSLVTFFGSLYLLIRTASLAYAELYLTYAAVFRRYEFELFKTDQSDVDLAHDFFLPSPKLDSKGIRVKCIKRS